MSLVNLGIVVTIIGGLFGLVFSLRKWRKEDVALIKQNANIERETQAYLNKTDEQELTIEALKGLIHDLGVNIDNLTNAIDKIQLQRADNVEREVVKYDSIRKIINIHVDEHPDLKEYVKKFDALDREEMIKRSTGGIKK